MAETSKTLRAKSKLYTTTQDEYEAMADAWDADRRRVAVLERALADLRDEWTMTGDAFPTTETIAEAAAMAALAGNAVQEDSDDARR